MHGPNLPFAHHVNNLLKDPVEQIIFQIAAALNDQNWIIRNILYFQNSYYFQWLISDMYLSAHQQEQIEEYLYQKNWLFWGRNSDKSSPSEPGIFNIVIVPVLSKDIVGGAWRDEDIKKAEVYLEAVKTRPVFG